MSAYWVPAVTVTGEAKLAVYVAAEPLEKPVIVPVARSGPVGRPALVARSDTVMLGVVPVHALQNRLASTWVTGPESVGMKVWPDQLVAAKLVPVDWTAGSNSAPTATFVASWIAPGLAVRSHPLESPLK